MAQQEHDTSTTTPVRNAREVLSAKKLETSKKSSFPKITFTDTNTSGNQTVRTEPNYTMKTTQAQTKTNNTTTATQTPDRSKDTAEICVSRVDPNISVQDERTHNIEPPTMGSATLEANHEMITEELVATMEKATNTVESKLFRQRLHHYSDTPLFRQRLQRVLGVRFIAAATKKDRNFRPLINFVKKRDWEAIKASYGQYWHNIWNRLHVREDCLLIDERVAIPTQLMQTVCI